MATKKAVWQGFVLSPTNGKPVSGAEVRVFDADSGLAVTLYGDRDGGAGPGNPFFTDSEGFAQFYVDPARIRIEAYDGGQAAQFDDVLVGTLDDGAITADMIADGSITTDKLADDAVTIDKIDADLVQYADNVAELRALEGLVDGQAVEMTGTGRAGLFIIIGDAVDYAAELAADPQEGVYVETVDGKVLKRSGVGNSVFAPWFGVLANGADDDIAALQAAGNYAQSLGLSLELPPTLGTYIKTLSTWVVASELNVSGCGEDACIIRCEATDGSDAVRLSDTVGVRGITWQGFAIECGPDAGHCIDIGWAIVRSEINLRLKQENVDKSCVNGDFIGGGGCYDTTWGGGEWRLTTSHNVPGFKVISDGTTFNTNTIKPRRIYYGLGAQFIWLECTSPNWFLTNTIWKPECEITNGGIIALFGCKDTEIYSPIIWDLSAANSGTMYNDGILLSSSSFGTGRSCRNTYIHGYQRTAGTLDAGVKDINLADAQDTIFINCNNPSTSPVYEIDLGNSRVTWFGSKSGITFTGVGAASSSFYSHNLIEVPRESIPINGGVATISSGEVTALGGFFRVETEGGAATDDLDTVTAPSTDGERITFRRFGANEVVVKNASGNLYTKSGADVTLDTVRKTISFQWDRLLSVWLEV